MAKTIQIPEAGVIDVLTTGSDAERSFLTKLLKDQLPSLNIFDRVKTFEDAVAIVGATDNQRILLDYNGNDAEMLAAQAFMKLSIIRTALNEGWTPDWDNSNEYKYYPYFYMDKGRTAGSGFAFGDCGFAYSGSGVGSRLVFKTENLAKYAGTQFLDVYRLIHIL